MIFIHELSFNFSLPVSLIGRSPFDRCSISLGRDRGIKVCKQNLAKGSARPAHNNTVLVKMMMKPLTPESECERATSE